MRLNKKFLTILLSLTIVLSGCGGAPTEEQLSNDDAVLTLAVGTMVAGFFGTQTAMVTPLPPDTSTPLPTNTFPPVPTPINTQPPAPLWTPTLGFFFTVTPGNPLTPSVTGTLPTATANTGALAFGCNNSIFIRDVNYPSGTTVSAGENFTKIWKVENNGTCDWQYNYLMAVVVDKDFDSSWNHLGRNVAPGNWAEVSVIVTAPDHDGTFTGSWRMADAGGNPFGATLSLSIVVP